MSPFDKISHVENLLVGMEEELADIGERLMQTTEIDHLIVDANIAQMQEGRRADGSEIKPDYTENTKAIKDAKGQPVDRVTLNDTGDFRLNMKVKASRTKLEILSTDSKSDDLQEKYQKSIFGLNDEHLIMVRDFLKPKFIFNLRKYINS